MTNNEIEALVAKQKALDEIGEVVGILETALDHNTPAIRMSFVRSGNHVPFETIGEDSYLMELTENLLDLFAEAYEKMADEMNDLKICVQIPDAETKTLYQTKNIL